MDSLLVLIESPYAAPQFAEPGDREAWVQLHLRYARACMADSLGRGEFPLASHLLYTQPGILDDADPEQRQLGIEAGLAWGRMAARTAVYTNLGVTQGMTLGILRAEKEKRPVEYRRLRLGWLKDPSGVTRSLLAKDRP